MFDVLLADFSLSESSEWLTAVAVIAVAGGLLLGYSLECTPPSPQSWDSCSAIEPDSAVISKPRWSKVR